MTAAPRFIHLRLHTEYSLLEGAVRLSDLPGLCRSAEMPAVAVTDTGNLFCALEFSEKAAAAGIQPIHGCQVVVTGLGGDARQDRRGAPAGTAGGGSVVLLAQNRTGLLNLFAISSAAYLESTDGLPAVDFDRIAEHAEGLICLTGGAGGPLGCLVRAGDQTAAAEALARMKATFDNRLYVEIQRHPVEGGLPAEERATENAMLALAYDADVPLVATNDVHFPDQRLFEAHDALICIAEGAYVDQQAPRRRLTPQHFFKSQSEMVALFADLPEAVENTVEIASRCAVRVQKHDPILPRFAKDEVDELRRQAEEGLAARLAVIPHAAEVSAYQERLEFELGIINKMGFPGYFLIVADFIKWAKERDIPVGPGRGSGAGSLVAYALTITDLDPLRYGLLFERFLNPDRVSMPDFDIDFCMDRREEVIAYVQDRYGKDRVAQIITFGALLSKAAVRDVGRVLQMPYSQVDRLSKMIPMEGPKPVSLNKALAEEPRLRAEADAEEVVARLLQYGQQVEGLLRNASTHAAGVVIGDRPLEELVPLYRDPRSEMPATQFNMKWVEAAGLVKFDFLGLKTLTVIQNAVDLIRASGRPLHIGSDRTELYEPPAGAENDIGAIPLDDIGTYEMYARAQTVGVFQVESSGMMDALKRMRPTTIEDIVALVALYRPGPMENIPKYCEVKNGRSEREAIHPLIDHILDETQGIIVYQEQVMQIAQEMAGYSLGGADLLRRAMGKKIQAAMDAERPKFLAGAAEKGVDKDKALEVWNLLDKFANYGFNKSHAAAYAVVSYQTAWLKSNHPAEYMAGAMACDLHNSDKLAVFYEEVHKGLGIDCVPPCVNRSGASFTVSDGKLVYALGALKNVGLDAMQSVVDARGDAPFVNLFDFARRVDLRRVGKRPLEMLARAGAFDQLDENRRRVLESLDALVAYSSAAHEQRNSSQVSLFGDAGDDLPEPRLSSVEDWLPVERLTEEARAVGFYLSGHPLDDYMADLRRQDIQMIEDVQKLTQSKILRMAGSVAGRQERKSARGNRFAFVQLSDPTGQYEVTLFSEALDAARDLLVAGAQVVLEVEVAVEEEQLRLRARSVMPIDSQVKAGAPKELKIFVDEAGAVENVLSVLSNAPAQGVARGPVSFCVMDPDQGEISVELGRDYPVTPRVRGALRSLSGVLEVQEL